MHVSPSRRGRVGLFTAAAAAIVPLFAILPAHAQPPQGRYQSETVIVCDTAEQIRAIVAAGKKDDETGAFTQFSAFTRQMNAAKEPACTIIDVNASADRAIELGTFSIFAATPRHAWAVHIHTGGVDGWMLYTEAAPEYGGRAFAKNGDATARLM